MPTGQGLADLLSGAAGAPVNRPQLNAFVANSQAMNGLRSAQTEEALTKAQEAQDQMNASSQLEDSLGKVMGEGNGAQAHAAATIMKSHFGDAKVALDAVKRMVLGDPGQLGAPNQTAAQQAVQGKVAEPVAVPNTYATLPGAYTPEVQQTPAGVAETGLHNAQANLAQAQANDPAAFHPKGGAFAGLPPDQSAALQKAVAEGRLDPTRINSRTAPVLAQMEMGAPGQVNFNRLHADAALQGNASFQQKAMSIDMLPGLLGHVTTLGKKLNGGAGYSDLKTVGMMQQFMNGQLNDPDYTEYMTARNDTLLRLAGVMRGVGMSDQAHTAEVQAMAPTLAPYALDAWLKGQMSVVTPLLERQNRITHLGEKGGGTAPLNAPTPAATAAPSAGPTGAVVSLDDWLKSQGH